MQPFSEIIPSDLMELVAAWHRLPDAIRAGIMAMVRSVGGEVGLLGDEGEGSDVLGGGMHTTHKQ